MDEAKDSSAQVLGQNSDKGPALKRAVGRGGVTGCAVRGDEAGPAGGGGDRACWGGDRACWGW